MATIVLMGFTSATLVGMIAGALSMDWVAFEAFAVISATYAMLSLFIYLVSSARPGPLSRPGMFFAVIVMWLTLVLAAMAPFMLIEKAGPVVAFFEASSAATSLGTTLTPLSEMSSAMTLFRSVTAWLGGLLTLTGQGLKIMASDNIEMLLALGRDPLVIKETRIDAIYGLTGLMDQALAAAARLDLPTLILYGQHDQIIPAEATERMLARLPPKGQKRRKVVFYENGYHMLLRDLQAETVWSDIADWIDRQEVEKG